jgi:hypothetical protein
MKQALTMLERDHIPVEVMLAVRQKLHCHPYMVSRKWVYEACISTI